MRRDDLEKLRNAEIHTCNADELTDLRNVTVNRKMPFGERTSDFMGQVHNPYLFRVGSTAVKVEFGNGKAFSEILANVIRTG